MLNRHLRVISVHPGVIATPMVVQEDTKGAAEAFAKHIPLRGSRSIENGTILSFR